MAYILNIKLNDRTPKNERTIQIVESCSFVELADTICRLYGLEGEHLREFVQKQKLCINHPEIDVSASASPDFFADDEDMNDPELLEDVDNTRQVSSVDYVLSEYFENNDTIVFHYDFLAGWSFAVQKIEKKESKDTKNIVVLGGIGTYLLEDCGGAAGLKEQLAMYKKKKFDEEQRETFEDFAEWVEPATRQFVL